MLAILNATRYFDVSLFSIFWVKNVSSLQIPTIWEKKKHRLLQPPRRWACRFKPLPAATRPLPGHFHKPRRHRTAIAPSGPTSYFPRQLYCYQYNSGAKTRTFFRATDRWPNSDTYTALASEALKHALRPSQLVVVRKASPRMQVSLYGMRRG